VSHVQSNALVDSLLSLFTANFLHISNSFISYTFNIEKTYYIKDPKFRKSCILGLPYKSSKEKYQTYIEACMNLRRVTNLELTL